MLGVADHRPLPAPQAQDQQPVHLRRADNNDRFVAFAFAGADMVIETDESAIVTYAAGAFRSKFGRPSEAFIGHSLRELVAPVDHEALDTALSLLMERGRLLPLMIRLSDHERTPLALAGMALPSPGVPRRLCLSLARPPAPLASVRHAGGTPHALARATEARLRAGTPCDLRLIEITGKGSMVISSSEAIGQAIEAAAPDSLANELAAGRFGLLGPGGTEADLLSVTTLLEAALRKQGVEVSVAARHLSLATEQLTPIQTARALRQALNVFAREGAAGLGKAGFDGGLAGYIRRAGAQVASLRQAIRGNQFSLEFQSIASLANGAPHHFEALIRPKRLPDCSFSGPQEFVMLVEALGLADELDLAVARLACEAAGKAGTPVAFNLSGQSVQSSAFRERLVRLLAPNPARKAGLIIIEMTETAEIEEVEEASLTAEMLRSLDIAFCLDDFGAGAADIRLLRALTPDIVKLDGSYIPGIGQDGRERAFVAGMVEIIRAARAEIVAERVETEAEAEALRLLGVQYGQGWLFGHPGPLPSTWAGSHRRPTRRPDEKASCS
jgi:EAL domain-containing protein (putative c-di-GMP-specific phosphodiesterase class I)